MALCSDRTEGLTHVADALEELGGGLWLLIRGFDYLTQDELPEDQALERCRTSLVETLTDYHKNITKVWREVAIQRARVDKDARRAATV